MNAKELEQAAIEQVAQTIRDGGPPEPRIVHCEAERAWSSLLLRDVSDHRLHVLGRAADIVVFFDEDGKEIGWRDDGRHGAPLPGLVERDVFLVSVVRELELPRDSRLGELMPRELPPLGWTLAGVVFTAPVPTPDQVVRVWTEPGSLRVIQCLFGPVSPARSTP